MSLTTYYQLFVPIYYYYLRYICMSANKYEIDIFFFCNLLLKLQYLIDIEWLFYKSHLYNNIILFLVIQIVQP